jgi:hypothetical protein
MKVFSLQGFYGDELSVQIPKFEPWESSRGSAEYGAEQNTKTLSNLNSDDFFFSNTQAEDLEK